MAGSSSTTIQSSSSPSLSTIEFHHPFATMAPSSPESCPPLPCAPQDTLSSLDQSPCIRRHMAPATSPPAAAATSDAGDLLEESLQLTDTGDYTRLLSFLEREPSVFTPWNPLPSMEEEDSGAAAEAGSGEKIRLGKGPILPFPVDRATNFGWQVVEVRRRVTVMVCCPCCVQGFGYLSSCGRLMPCLSCAWRHYAMFCTHESMETLNDQSSLSTPL